MKKKLIKIIDSIADLLKFFLMCSNTSKKVQKKKPIKRKKK